MHERSCFWKAFGSERVNEFQKLLKSAGKYLYPTFSSFWANMSEKKSFLVRSQILGLLVNTLTANYEYSRSIRENSPLPIQMQLSEKGKPCSQFFYCIFGTYIKFWTFWKKKKKKKRASWLKYFWSYWLQTTCLLKCVKGLVSQNPLAVNVLKNCHFEKV